MILFRNTLNAHYSAADSVISRDSAYISPYLPSLLDPRMQKPMEHEIPPVMKASLVEWLRDGESIFGVLSPVVLSIPRRQLRSA